MPSDTKVAVLKRTNSAPIMMLLTDASASRPARVLLLSVP